MIGVKIGRGAGRGGSAPWGILGAWVGWSPPAPTAPWGIPWAGLGVELPGNSIPKPRDAGAEHPPRALPALGTGTEQQVGASGLALPAGDFQGQESHPKRLNPQILTAEAGSFREQGKGDHKQGWGCPQSTAGILQGPTIPTAPISTSTAQPELVPTLLLLCFHG